MLGYMPDEMIGRPVTDFIFEEDLPDHLANMKKRSLGVGEKIRAQAPSKIPAGL